ncbi:Methylthioribose-1-phosphate isomerase [Cladorrhinum sp. PSN259]|nr:Methylthioribose-1-phosphate isomerase [Cladorrhinum sp. PSN259]
MSRTHGTDEWKKRSVVSSFIFKFDDSGQNQPKVALFKRSDKVSTYQHHLAPISGSIEPTDPSPLATAWREIWEETTLNSQSLTLLRKGKSYSFSDPSVKREWTIYPFLFRLKTPDDEQHVKIDWEHEDWGWHDPNEVIKDDSYAVKGVPRLAESLRRVWFETDLGPEAGKILSKGLNTLAHDHESGARQLAGTALQTLRDIISVLPQSEDWWKLVRTAAWHLSKNGRESMGAAITSVLLSALSQIEPAATTQPSSHIQTDKTLSQLDTLLSSRQSSISSLTATFQSYLSTTFSSSTTNPISLLTLSESSTITHVLTHPSTPPLSISILESRPLFEGISFASSLLSKSNHKIQILPDTSPSLSCHPSLQILLIGADRISPEGAVLNKMGSLPAILTARFLCPTVKVIVLGETEKIAVPPPSSSVSESEEAEENDHNQVSRAWNAANNSERVREGAKLIKEKEKIVTVRNVFFEWVPASLVDVYVTEKGVRTVGDIARHADKMAQEQERLFGDL